MNPSDLQLLAGVSAAAAAITSGLTIWNFLQSPAKKNAEAIAELRKSVTIEVEGLDKRLDTVESGLGRLSTVVDNLPTRDMFHSLDKELTKLGGTVEAMNVGVQANARSAARIEQFLIDEARQKMAQTPAPAGRTPRSAG